MNLPTCMLAGDYQGRCASYMSHESDSGAVGVILSVMLEEKWDADTETWVAISPQETSGYICLITGKGEAMEKNGRMLVAYAGWDGSLLSISEEQWTPGSVQVKVKADVRKGVPQTDDNGNQRFTIDRIAELDSVPGVVGIPASRAQALDAVHSCVFGAIAANVKRNAPAQSAKPPKPPLDPNAQLQEAAEEQGDADVPY